ncbi:MAG TPA: phosphatidate cytidylyltransferase [Prosthecobacter sp.]|nr:phosphatidate cytidylyltransferase [Prosthecobacter sp.]
MSSAPTVSPPSKGRVFAARLFSTLLLWAVLIVAFYLNSAKIVTAIIALFGLATSWEYYRLLRRPALTRSFVVLGLSISLAYWGVVGWSVFSGRGAPPAWLNLAALVAAVHGSFLLCYRHQLAGMETLQRIFATIFGVIYTVILFGFVVHIMYAARGGAEAYVYLVLFLVMVTKFCDMGAYAVGVVLGKHKMIPHISPAKSWEGFFGAFAGGLGGAAIILWAFSDKLGPLTWTHGMLVAPLLCIAGITGDLAESVLKRCTAIKDSGHALPGIGGILDLTDSLLFTAPVFYFYLLAIQG